MNKLKINKDMQTVELCEGKHCTVYIAHAILIAKLITNFKFLILKNVKCLFLESSHVCHIYMVVSPAN